MRAMLGSICFLAVSAWAQESVVATDRTLHLQSDIEGLHISIDDRPRGITTQGGILKLDIKEDVGTGGFGFHKLVVYKEINATHEYYAEREFKYKPYDPIHMSKDTLQPRLKRALLAKQNGLLQSVQLKHRLASKMATDERFIYVLSQSRSKVYSTQKREPSDAEYLEIYDKKTLALVHEMLLNAQDLDSFDRDILLHQGYLYVASKNGKVLFWETKKLLTEAPKELVTSDKELNRLRGFGAYLFRFGKGGIVEIYHHNVHVKSLDTKKQRFKGYETLEDKRFDRIFDVLYTDNTLFVANDLGEVQVYALGSSPKESSFITTLRDINVQDAYDVLALALYDKQTLAVGTDGHGLVLYDTKTLNALASLPNIPKNRVYRMRVWNDTVLLTQELDSPHLYRYDLKRKKITHDFQGEANEVMDFEISDEKLYTLDDGHVYVWNVNPKEEGK
ncbi:hypothetical protein [Sulfurospirillum sp. MES]|uniref:hypothetical protein n=1 Tax=Sulfurospirillum sp. MES TaxID=1565314 RepID=UPI0005436113|nr:hypothetical protein [Sulfurospirillum sp. MES]KHG33024.1 MAG: hypothetical protein OA34_12190 [Sulfurospirillum sp. MES]